MELLARSFKTLFVEKLCRQIYFSGEQLQEVLLRRELSSQVVLFASKKIYMKIICITTVEEKTKTT